MIEYEVGTWQILFLFKLRGSVFPRAAAWALVCAVVALLMKHYVPQDSSVTSVQLWSGYNFILGFLVVFRTQQAYSRFWEGATLLQEVRVGWLSATSSCFAFCTNNPEMRAKVEIFQHLLVRLVSLLYCTALQQVAVLSDEAFEVIDLDGMDEASLEYLAHAPEKCLVVLQWIQKLIVLNASEGVIDVPAPLLTRTYQELSQGMVRVGHAQTITDIMFPFPYAQMVTLMLLTTTIITPFISAAVIDSYVYCTMLSFMPVFCFWSLNYIAAEIEMPFGEDANDLPIPQLQLGMNMGLRILLDDEAKTPPSFFFDAKVHREAKGSVCPYDLITDHQHLLWSSVSQKLERGQQENRRKTFSRPSRLGPLGTDSGSGLGSIFGFASSVASGGSAIIRSSIGTWSKTSQDSDVGSVRHSGRNSTERMQRITECTEVFSRAGSNLSDDEVSECYSSAALSPIMPSDTSVRASSPMPRRRGVPEEKFDPLKDQHQHTATYVSGYEDFGLRRSLFRLESHFALIAHNLRLVASGTALDSAIKPESCSETTVVRLLDKIEDHCLDISKGVGELALTLGATYSSTQQNLVCEEKLTEVVDIGEASALTDRPAISL